MGLLFNSLQISVSLSQQWSTVRILKAKHENWPNAVLWSHEDQMWELMNLCPLKSPRMALQTVTALTVHAVAKYHYFIIIISYHIIYDISYHFIMITSIKISYHYWLFLGNRIRLDDIPECMPINAYISSSVCHLPQLELTLHFAFPGNFLWT